MMDESAVSHGSPWSWGHSASTAPLRLAQAALVTRTLLATDSSS